jgi:DNA polymerase III epsilon subunit-like protein
MIATIFDCETTGVPKNYKAPMTDLDNWPRVTQIACLVVDTQTSEVINEYQSLIKPDGWVVPKDKFFIENNMSTERCNEFGLPFTEVANVFINDLNLSGAIVAHNLNFDYPVVGSELIRYGLKASRMDRKKICTMMSSTNYCALPRMKWPKLVELHNKLFGCDFQGQHDALDDVRATTACFLELIKRKVIVL